MFCVRILTLIVALVIWGGPGSAATADAAPPACKGQNLLEEIEATDRTSFDRIVEAARAETNTEAMLWRITKGSKPPSWLFGTIHLTDERVHRLRPAVTDALSSAKVLALEIEDLSDEAMMKAMSATRHITTLPRGETIRSILTAEELASLRDQGSVRGGEPEGLMRLRPWFIAMMLAVPACEDARRAAGLMSLDSSLRQRALKAGKRVVGLETIAEQMKALASMTKEAELAWLRWSIRLYPRVEDITETTVQLYLQRNLGVAWPLSEAKIAGTQFPKEAIAPFKKALIDDRNARMRDRAAPLLEKGAAFIAVGALHLPGRQGLVSLFRDLGYSVTPAE